MLVALVTGLFVGKSIAIAQVGFLTSHVFSSFLSPRAVAINDLNVHRNFPPRLLTSVPGPVSELTVCIYFQTFYPGGGG